MALAKADERGRAGTASGRGRCPRPPRAKPLAAWTVADITRERAQQETVFQELQHAIDYLDHAPAGFFSAEPDGRIVYLNATLAEWLGIDLARFEPGTLTLADIVRGDGVALLRSAPADDRSNRTEIIDLDLIKRNGQSLPVRLLHRVPVAADGAPGRDAHAGAQPQPGRGGLGGAARGRSALHPLLQQHADRHRRGRPARPHRADQRAVPAPLRQTGDGARGRRRLVDLVAESDRPRLEAALEAAAAGASLIPPIDAALAGHGKRSARFFINPVEEGGDEEAVIVNAIDITEQRALEQQFAQSQKMQAVGQLAGGIAHDFNNVLTAIIGFSDLLLANHRPSDPSFQDIMNIKQNANRAAGLVRQLLAFSRRQTLRPQVLSARRRRSPTCPSCCSGCSARTSSSRSSTAATCGRSRSTSTSSSR